MQTRASMGLAALLLGLCVSTVDARTVAECIDVEGNSSFRNQCPPGMTKKGEKKLRGIGGQNEPTVDQLAKDMPITVFSVPKCDACDLVRHRLNTHQLPFTEKNVQDDVKAQEELKAATGGVTVPSILIGTKSLSGYNGEAMDAALKEAGYTLAQ